VTRWGLVLALLSAASVVRAQESTSTPAGGPSITDAELEVLCSDAARAVINQQMMEGTPEIDELEKEVEDSLASERKARKSLAAVDVSTPSKQKDAQEKLEDARAQREAAERTLSEMRAANLQSVETTTNCSIDQKLYDSYKQRVCGAYARHKPIPWEPAAAVASCMRKQPMAKRAVGVLVEERPELKALDAAPRALTGTSLEDAILRGTADFLVQRGEQELELFAMQAMSEQLCEDKLVSSLLSRTCLLAAEENDEKAHAAAESAGDDEEPLFAVTLATLREAARADLEALPTWLSNRLARNQPAAACAFEVGWAFSERVLHGADVVETLGDLEVILDELEGKAPCNQSSGFVDKLRKASQAIEMVNTTRGVNVVGLVQSGELDSVVSRAAPDLTRKEPTRQDELSDAGKTVREVLQRIRELQRALGALDKDPTGANRAIVINAALRTIEPLLIYAGTDPGKTTDYFATVSQIVLDIGNRKYVAATVTLSSSQLLKDVTANGKISRNFRVLVTLGATIAEADSSDAVKNALDEAALPLQSWRRKNVADFGGTITGLFGFMFAYEFPVERTRSDETAPGAVTFAPTLSLGVDVHWGFESSRAGLFLSVLDLGALATIRVTNPESSSNEAQAERDPEVRFEQVLAPGIYPYYGIGPFDIGAGIGFVPSLRAARDRETRDFEALNVLRLGAFVAVDISVLPLF
jgi:hypothetical protein